MAQYYAGTTREVRIGDRVIVIREYDGNSQIIGQEGIVRRYDHTGRPGIEFFAYISRCHDLSGTIADGHGWYCEGSVLRYAGETDASVKNCCYMCGAEITKKSKLGARILSGECLCDSCIAKRIGKINGYHFGKELKYAYAKDKITLGVEIEIDDSDESGDSPAVIKDVIRCARDNNYPLIMSHEHDGSLCCDGFESVTAPLSISEWKSTEVQEQIHTLFESARDNGYTFYEDDHAGLHVHIGRKDLCGTDRAVSDAVGLLMGWAVTRLWDKGFERLSRREDMYYCKLLGDGRTDGLYDTGARCDRYYAVNIENAKTIELRIFKGASCLDDVLLAVDMCYMLGKWATKKIMAFKKRGTYSARALKFDDALEYADRVTWSALAKYSKFPEITLTAMRRAGIEI